MDRRGFMGAILAGCAMPAIVRAESLMRMVVRPSGLIVPSYSNKLITPAEYAELTASAIINQALRMLEDNLSLMTRPRPPFDERMNSMLLNNTLIFRGPSKL